jgi:hypothetical protein
MRRIVRRSGSPIHDTLGFLGTQMGREYAAEEKKAQGELNAIVQDMSVNEANEWLKNNYPQLRWSGVHADHPALIRKGKDFKFSNKNKIIFIRSKV